MNAPARGAWLQSAGAMPVTCARPGGKRRERGLVPGPGELVAGRMNRITAWYRREQPFARTTAVLSAGLVMVALLLTAMVTWGNDSIPVVFAFGAATGFGMAAAAYLALTVRAWRERNRSRRAQ